MNIAGHVSRAMLSRYSHVRMEAKRRVWTRSPRASVRRMRSARRKLGGGSKRRRSVKSAVVQ